MKRRSRPSPAAPLNRLLLATLLLLAFAGSIGVSMVWLRHEVSGVAQGMKLTQARLAEVRRSTAEVNAQIAAACTAERLMLQNNLLRLGLARPADGQIVAVANAETLFAQKRNTDRFELKPVSFQLPGPR